MEWKETSVERGSNEKKLAIQQKKREKLFPSRGCCLHFRATERCSHERRGSKIKRRGRETFLRSLEEKQDERARKNVHGGYRRSKGKRWLPQCRAGIFATARDGQRFGSATPAGLQTKVSKRDSSSTHKIRVHSFQRRSNKKIRAPISRKSAKNIVEFKTRLNPRLLYIPDSWNTTRTKKRR